MSNIPYNEDHSIIPTIAMTGVLAAGGTAAYYAMTDPDKLTKVFNSAVDWIAPVHTESRSALQEKVIKVSEGRKRNAEFGKRRKEATYSDREEKLTKTINNIETNGNVRRLNVQEDSLDQAISSIRSKVGSADYLHISDIKSLSDIRDIHGNEYGPTLIKNYEDSLGGKAKDIKFEGTNVSFDINGERVTIPTSVKDTKTGAWVSKSNGTYRVHSLKSEMTLNDGELGLNIIGPNEHLGRMFEVPEHLGIQRGIFSSLNTNETNRDLISAERKYLGNDLAPELKRIVGKLKGQIEGQTAVTDLRNHRELKQVLEAVKANAQPVAPTDYAQIQYLGKQVDMTMDSLHDVERRAGGNLEGLAETHVSIGKSIFQFREGESVNMSGASKMRGFGVFQDVRSNRERLTIGGKYREQLGAEGQGFFDSVQKNIGLTLSQSQSGEMMSSFTGTMAAFPSVEINKAYGKKYSFTEPVNQIPFRVNSSRASDPSKAISQDIRVKPLIHNPDVANASKYVYENNNSMVNMFTVLGHKDMEESILLSKRMQENMGIRKDVSLKVKNVFSGNDLPTESYVKYVLEEPDENGILRDYSYSEKSKKTLADLYENPEMLKKVKSIEYSPGTILGLNDPTGQIDSTASLDTVMGKKYTLTKNKLKLTQDRRQILATLEEMKSSKNGSFTIYGSQHETASKLGSNVWNGRSAIEYLSDEGELSNSLLERIGRVNNTLVAPEAIVSREMYKSVLTKMKNGELVSGKGRTAFVTFLQEAIAGNVGANAQNIRLEGKIKDKFTRLLTNPTDFNGNLTDLFTSTKLQFNQHAVEGKDDISTLVKVLSGVHKNRKTGGAIGDSLTYEDASRDIENWIEGTTSVDKMVEDPFFMLQGMVAHEGQEAQGIGSNIYRIGLKDSPGLMPSEWMGELETRNIAETTQINTDVKLMLEGKARNITGDLQKLGVNVLDKNGLEKMLGPITNAADVSDPFVIANSFLSKDVNPKGFALAAEDGSIHHFGGGATYGGGQWLDAEGKAAVQSSTRKETRILLSALENGGVLSQDDLRKLYTHRKESYAAPGGGPLKTGSMHIEGAEYGINLSETNWINNKSIKEKLAINEEAHNMFGSVAVMDRKVYQKSIYNDLEAAMILGKKEGRTTESVLREQFGEGHFLEEFMSKPIETASHAMDVAKEATNEMVRRTTVLKKMAMGSSSPEEISEFIRKNAHPMLVDRFPHVAAKSTSTAMGFVDDLQGAGKSIALGHMLRLNMNADNDGDKIFALLGHNRILRETNRREILGAQKIAAEYMNFFNKRDLLEAGMSVKGEAKFKLPEFRQLDSLVEAMKNTEAESAMTAFITKGITGSANVRANEIRNALLTDINKNKTLTGDSLDHAISFAFALPGQNIEQKIISGKQTEAVIGVGSPFHKVESLVRNIGHVDKKEFLSGIASLSGEMTPMQMYTTMIGAQLRNNSPAWLNPRNKDSVIPQLDTLMNMNFKWRRLEGDEGRKEFDALHDMIQTAKDQRDQLWKQYNDVADKTAFLTQRKAIQEAGWDKFSNIRELFDHARTQGAGSASDSIDIAWRNAIKEISATREKLGVKEVEDIWMKHAGRVSSTQKDMAFAILADSKITAESMAQKSTRGLRYWQEIKQAVGPLTPMKVGGAIGAGLVALTALNVLGGDGTPEDPNDLPSVSNPSFARQTGGQMGERRVLNSPVSTNMSMGLITGSHEQMHDSMQSVSAMYQGSTHNMVAVKSDGSNPYSADMFKYTN